MSPYDAIYGAGPEVSEKEPWNRPHDACGLGFVATVDGRPDPLVMQYLLHGASRISHRGGGGDGAGILTQIPQRLFREALSQESIRAPATPLSAGQFFMPPDTAAQGAIQSIFEREF